MPKDKGFTLVELMVVISIIAILAVVGITIFSGVQKGARDARRRTDIDAIANALEVNKTSGGYIPFAPDQVETSTQFVSGSIPHDPKRTAEYQNPPSGGDGCGTPGGGTFPNGCWYCFRNENGNAMNSQVPGVCGDSSPYLNQLINSTYVIQNGWMACANLENSPYFYCKRNTQ